MWSQPFTAFRSPFSRSPFARRAGSVLRYPEAGLTGGVTLAKATPLNAFVNKATHALFACDFIALDPSVDGFLWESGGAGFGNYVGFKAGALVVRAFNGAARWSIDTAYLTSTVPSGTGTLSWAIEIGTTSRVRAWWNGVELAQTGQSVGARADWGGADEGMFMGSGSGGIVIGEVTAATALVSATYVSDLRYYSGQKAGAGKISLPDAISFTAVAEASTPAQPLPNLLLNDDIAATSIVSIDGVPITLGGSATTPDAGAGTFTVGSDGAATFTPGAAFAYLPLGRTATASAVYVTDRGGSASITATVAGSLELAYALAIEDGGSITGDPVGAVAPGAVVNLSGLSAITAATVGAVTRTGGAAGIAALTFPTDAAYIGYTYIEAPAIYLLAFALRVMIPAGTATGRIAETVATNGGGYLLEVVGPDLVLTVDDGAGVVLTLPRPIPAYDTPFTVATAIGPAGLMLALSGDNAAAVDVLSVGAYSPPIADRLRIGGAGAMVLGGTLYHPRAFTTAGLITVMDDVSATYAGATVDEGLSTGATFATVVDGGVTYRLASFPSSGSLVVTGGALPVEYLLVGGGGGGGRQAGGQSGGGGGAGRFVPGATLLPAGAYTATVGAGSSALTNPVANGADTVLTNGAGIAITALGGGAGGAGAGGYGQDGGSGGGAGRGPIGTLAGVALAGVGYGNDGGQTPGEYTNNGSGGGGAGAPGTGGTYADGQSCGGVGFTSTITGTAILLAGGGGGGSLVNTTGPTRGLGGLGGGGNGAKYNLDAPAGMKSSATPGAANTGGGGGGGVGTEFGAAGGSGVVRLRWAI